MRIDLDDNTDTTEEEGDSGLIIRSESLSRRKRRGPTPAQMRRTENLRIIGLVVVIFASIIGFVLYQSAQRNRQGSSTLAVETPRQQTVGRPAGPTVVPGGAGPMAAPGQRRAVAPPRPMPRMQQGNPAPGPPDDGVGEGRSTSDSASDGME